jgi:lipid-A-disaccharide synthase
MRYYLIAGERSGDLHGSNLIKALKKYDTSAAFKGFGGDYMKEAGLDLTVHYQELAFMGLKEFFLNLRKISAYIKKCKNDILTYKPDVVILIDYAGFNRRIGAFCKTQGIKVFYYISPKVWAWRQNRAWALKKTIDRMFVILPFEKDFFKQKVNWEVDYVGNPVLDAVKSFKRDENFKSRYNLPTTKKWVALLPGSRAQELRYILPVMAEVIENNPDIHFGVATVSNLDRALYKPFSQFTNVSFIEEATYDLLSIAQAAVVTSGTATLETCLFNVPQVVVYKTSSLNYFIGKQVVKVPFISLVNLVAGRQVVRELLQEECTAQTVSQELGKLLNDVSYRNTVIEGNKEVYQILDIGSASDNAGRLMVGYLGANK